MKFLEVLVKGESQPLVIQVSDYTSPDGWLRDEGKYVVLNNTSYRRDDIISVSISERRARHGFTNMGGI